ncbi:MAG: GTP-binding protein [Deltaproteobacteria bacterium]
MTGFLGSGKTTLIAHLLESPAASGTAVIVNEVGDVSIDDRLVAHVTEDVQVLASGCLCCTLRDDLAGAIEQLHTASVEAGRAISRVVLETSGIADPAPIVHSAARDPRLAARLRVAGVVAVVDASRALTLLDTQPEVARQIDIADHVVLTKEDVAPEGAVEAIEALLTERYPGRGIERGPAALLVGAPTLTSRAEAAGWLAPLHDGDAAVDRRTIDLPSPVCLDALALWHRMVTSLDGLSLLRIKGIVEADGARWVMQSAQHAVFEPRPLAGAPEAWSGSRLVVLSRGMPKPALDRLEEAAVLAARGTRRRPVRQSAGITGSRPR